VEYIVILCFERRFSEQNSVIRLKSNIFPPTNFWLATPLTRACYICCNYTTKSFLRFRNLLMVCPQRVVCALAWRQSNHNAWSLVATILRWNYFSAGIECMVLWGLIYFNFGLPRNVFARPSDSKEVAAPGDVRN